MKKNTFQSRWSPVSVSLLRSEPALLLFCSLVFALGGCRQTADKIFPPVDPALTWPPSPADARIRYVGQLRSSADLKTPRGFFESMARFFTGEEEPSLLYGPRSVVCTPDGRRVWVADPGGRCVHGFDLEDRVYTKLVKIGESRLLSPVGLCLGPEKSIFICDSESILIHRIDSDDGRPLDTIQLSNEIWRPVALAFDASTNELFVVDAGGHDIKVLDLEGKLKRVIGLRGTSPGEFNFPCDAVLRKDRLWISDTGNQRIQEIFLDGEPGAIFGRAGDAFGDLAFPKGIAFDSDGHIYVVDSRFENIQIFDPGSGRLLLFFGHEGVEPGEFWLPSGLFIDAQDRIWVCDSYNGRIQVFQYIREVDDAGPQ